jgi:rod shape-determining protein MreD
MRRYLSLPLLLLAALLQATIVHEFRIGEAGPDLVLLVALAWGLLAGIEEGLLWAIVGGILLDLIAGNALGTSSLALVLAVGGICVLTGPIGKGNILLAVPLAAAATFILHLALVGIFFLAQTRVPLFYALLNITLPSALYNGLLMLVIYVLVGLLYRQPKKAGLG